MKLKLLLAFLILFSLSSFATQKDSIKVDALEKIEQFIIQEELDSTKTYINFLDDEPYSNLLKKLIKKEELTYREYRAVITTIGNKKEGVYQEISNYINKTIKEPINNKDINLDYLDIIWNQVTRLRDEGALVEAGEINFRLEKYVSKFNSNDTNVLYAKTKIKTHNIVLYLIQKETEKGVKLCYEAIETAKKLKNKELQIIFLYHLCDFLVLENKLQEFIDASEKSLSLESTDQKSTYYIGTLEHLVDAYIYKGGNDNRVKELLDTLYKNPHGKANSYAYYFKYLATLPKNSLVKKEILKKFEVNSLPELVKKAEAFTKDKLVPNHRYLLFFYAADALAAHEYYNEAMSYKNECVNITRQIYSEDLAKTLGNFNTEQAIKIKEQELAYEKEKTKLYAIAAALIGVLLFITILVLLKFKKQSKELNKKNFIINKTLKEKELLIKEVHHRVKNNFQIVASLLELQSKDIEDVKALEMANEGKNRVKSMALIHQKLYQNDTGLVDFDDYIKLLVGELSSLYSSDKKITTTIDSVNMKFDVDTAIPLGLIINEIITNSYKYAFKDGKENNLRIAIKKENKEEYKLIIEDNGPGLSINFDSSKVKSLGLRLVKRLVKQLQGSLIQTNNNGAKFEILFKDFQTRKLVD